MGRSAADRSYLSIREVLDLLVEEFPDVTISKIRFLESRGLIHPERTPSGYRKFYENDVERLRWILRQQREHFLPLKVIKGRLEGGVDSATSTPSLFDDPDGPSPEDEELDLLPTLAAPARRERAAAVPGPAALTERPGDAAGAARPSAGEVPVSEEPSTEEVRPAPGAPAPAVTAPAAPTAPAEPAAPAAPAATASPAPGPAPAPAVAPTRVLEGPTPALTVPAATGAHFSAEELARAVGVEVALVTELEEFGFLAGREVAGVRCYDEEAFLIAQLAASFRRFGLESRHLRTFKHAAEREAGLYSQVVTPLLRQRNPAARERARNDLGELARLGAAFRDALVRAELRELTGG